MKPRQLELFGKIQKDHGGDARLGRRKIARPIARKRPMHLVLRSKRARGAWSMLAGPRRKHAVAQMIEFTAKKYGVRLYKVENVGNHLHLLVQARRRTDFQNFLRVLPQRLMFLVTGARKGNPKGKFWDGLAFTRVIEWGRDFQNARVYLARNKLEALGLSRTVLDQTSFVFKYSAPGPGS